MVRNKSYYQIGSRTGRGFARRTWSFTRGFAKGASAPYRLPAIIMKAINPISEVHSLYHDLGVVLGAGSIVAQGMGVVSKFPREYVPLAFSAFLAANAFSGVFEGARFVRNRAKEKKLKEERAE